MTVTQVDINNCCGLFTINNNQDTHQNKKRKKVPFDILTIKLFVIQISVQLNTTETEYVSTNINNC